MDTFCANTATIWRFVGEIIYIIRIVIPVIIILLGTLDLGKAVMSGEEKTVKEAQKNFIKRLIYGVAIFFIFVIVQVIFGLLGVETDKGDTKVCWDCATKPHNKSCIQYVKEQEKKEEESYNQDENDGSYDNNKDENNTKDENDKLDEM
ncbi:MAG: hypothetical protein Q4C29_01420 [bacterium]|nr:hypothetical protein [bacterium]